MAEASSSATQFYTVYPTNPNNAIEVAETQKFLDSIDDDVLENRNSEGLISWRVSLEDEASLERLKEHSGIRIVELEGSPLGQRSTETRRDEEKDEYQLFWILWAKDPDDTDVNKKIGDWLKTRTIDKGKTLLNSSSENGGVEFWAADLDEGDIEEAKKQPGVEFVYKDVLTEEDRYMPDHEELQVHGSGDTSMAKRETLRWTVQAGVPDWGLRDISRPKDLGAKDPGEMSDFVHEERAGEGVRVYVIDRGVELHVKDEHGVEIFSNIDDNDVISTVLNVGQSGGKLSDSSPGGHGTKVASKALSSRFGVAKNAKLIPVKINPGATGVIAGLDAIIKDLNAPGHAGYKDKAVVVCARSTPPNANPAPELSVKFTQKLGKLFKLGVPVVWSAGNKAKETGRRMVDSLPAKLTSPTLPLIVVGASTFGGNRADFSQSGDKVTILAPGEGVFVHDKSDGDFKHDIQGTSFAAPTVAGIIATYMNYDPPPWGAADLKGKQRVKAIRDYMPKRNSAWKRNNKDFVI
ncbi:subtilisin-like protein [Amniculicola lignicola CBS 123094]|uniref:Subtilisin-like protein n=1 Tax=Amniculicola lignicola CBS 123094 TaxID=1392246 RepID=A0A6A5X109_9PLEO|nr:subtilisin-like protein [Amniculicola lignicola CBS 123094]